MFISWMAATLTSESNATATTSSTSEIPALPFYCRNTLCLLCSATKINKPLTHFIPKRFSSRNMRKSIDRNGRLTTGSCCTITLFGGPMAEWLCSGLQNRVHRFNSGSGLHSSFRKIETAFCAPPHGASVGACRTHRLMFRAPSCAC